MSLRDSLDYISHEEGRDIELRVPGAKLFFKSPERHKSLPGGKLSFTAEEGIDAIEPFMIEKWSMGHFYPILTCNWPCYNEKAQTAITASVSAGVFILDEENSSEMKIETSEGFIKCLVRISDEMERFFAESFGESFEDYCKDRYFAKTPEDFSRFELEGLSCQTSLRGSNSQDEESARFNASISDSCILSLTFSVSTVDEACQNAPDLNDFKQYLVTEYLKHIRIETEA